MLLLLLLLPSVGCQFLIDLGVVWCQEKVNSLAVSQKEVNAEFKGSLHKELVMRLELEQTSSSSKQGSLKGSKRSRETSVASPEESLFLQH